MKRELLLMRDLVDNQLMDSQGERITKVAGVEAESREGDRPVVRALLVGPEPLARRIRPHVGRLMERVSQIAISVASSRAMASDPAAVR